MDVYTALFSETCTAAKDYSTEFTFELANRLGLFLNFGLHIFSWIIYNINATMYCMIILFFIHWLINMKSCENRDSVKGFIYGQERERFEIMRDLLMENNKELRTMREELRLLRKMNARGTIGSMTIEKSPLQSENEVVQ